MTKRKRDTLDKDNSNKEFEELSTFNSPGFSSSSSSSSNSSSSSSNTPIASITGGDPLGHPMYPPSFAYPGFYYIYPAYPPSFTHPGLYGSYPTFSSPGYFSGIPSNNPGLSTGTLSNFSSDIESVGSLIRNIEFNINKIQLVVDLSSRNGYGSATINSSFFSTAYKLLNKLDYPGRLLDQNIRSLNYLKYIEQGIFDDETRPQSEVISSIYHQKVAALIKYISNNDDNVKALKMLNGLCKMRLIDELKILFQKEKDYPCIPTKIKGLLIEESRGDEQSLFRYCESGLNNFNNDSSISDIIDFSRTIGPMKIYFRPNIVSTLVRIITSKASLLDKGNIVHQANLGFSIIKGLTSILQFDKSYEPEIRKQIDKLYKGWSTSEKCEGVDKPSIETEYQEENITEESFYNKIKEHISKQTDTADDEIVGQIVGQIIEEGIKTFKSHLAFINVNKFASLIYKIANNDFLTIDKWEAIFDAQTAMTGQRRFCTEYISKTIGIIPDLSEIIMNYLFDTQKKDNQEIQNTLQDMVQKLESSTFSLSNALIGDNTGLLPELSNIVMDYLGEDNWQISG